MSELLDGFTQSRGSCLYRLLKHQIHTSGRHLLVQESSKLGDKRAIHILSVCAKLSSERDLWLERCLREALSIHLTPVSWKDLDLGELASAAVGYCAHISDDAASLILSGTSDVSDWTLPQLQGDVGASLFDVLTAVFDLLSVLHRQLQKLGPLSANDLRRQGAYEKWSTRESDYSLLGGVIPRVWSCVLSEIGESNLGAVILSYPADSEPGNYQISMYKDLLLSLTKSIMTHFLDSPKWFVAAIYDAVYCNFRAVSSPDDAILNSKIRTSFSHSLESLEPSLLECINASVSAEAYFPESSALPQAEEAAAELIIRSMFFYNLLSEWRCLPGNIGTSFLTPGIVALLRSAAQQPEEKIPWSIIFAALEVVISECLEGSVDLRISLDFITRLSSLDGWLEQSAIAKEFTKFFSATCGLRSEAWNDMEQYSSILLRCLNVYGARGKIGRWQTYAVALRQLCSHILAWIQQLADDKALIIIERLREAMIDLWRDYFAILAANTSQITAEIMESFLTMTKTLCEMDTENQIVTPILLKLSQSWEESCQEDHHASIVLLGACLLVTIQTSSDINIPDACILTILKSILKLSVYSGGPYNGMPNLFKEQLLYSWHAKSGPPSWITCFREFSSLSVIWQKRLLAMSFCNQLQHRRQGSEEWPLTIGLQQTWDPHLGPLALIALVSKQPANQLVQVLSQRLGDLLQGYPIDARDDIMQRLRDLKSEQSERGIALAVSTASLRNLWSRIAFAISSITERINLQGIELEEAMEFILIHSHCGRGLSHCFAAFVDDGTVSALSFAELVSDLNPLITKNPPLRERWIRSALPAAISALLCGICLGLKTSSFPNARNLANIAKAIKKTLHFEGITADERSWILRTVVDEIALRGSKIGDVREECRMSLRTYSPLPVVLLSLDGGLAALAAGFELYNDFQIGFFMKDLLQLCLCSSNDNGIWEMHTAMINSFNIPSSEIIYLDD